MTDYYLLNEQIRALAEESGDPIPLMANAAALLFHTLPDINWAGFYLVKGGELLLGPFQGKVACVRIAKGKGVCGTAWEKNETMPVPDVHAFPGHISCDAESKSEIVIPIHDGGEVIAVLDIDSPKLDRFGEEDRQGLESFVKTMEMLLEHVGEEHSTQ